jgi:ABC-type methionine transport system permease subunit
MVTTYHAMPSSVAKILQTPVCLVSTVGAAYETGGGGGGDVSIPFPMPM